MNILFCRNLICSNCGTYVSEIHDEGNRRVVAILSNNSHFD